MVYDESLLIEVENISGPVWINIKSNPTEQSVLHSYKLKWGPWQFEGTLDFSETLSVSLIHMKGEDTNNIPLHIQVSPPCCVTCGQLDPPSDKTIDINEGWKNNN